MGLVLDTSVLIAAERRTFDLQGLLASVAEEPAAIAAITASELLYGVERTRDPVLRHRRRETVDALLDDVVVIAFGLAEARIHASLWSALSAKGRMIGAHDLQVAATALSIGSAVATLNQRELKRVVGLSLTPVARFVKA